MCFYAYKSWNFSITKKKIFVENSNFPQNFHTFFSLMSSFSIVEYENIDNSIFSKMWYTCFIAITAVLKNYLLFQQNFYIGMILSSSWVKLNKKVKKEICHSGDRTQAKKSNDFQKMISVKFRLTIAALCFILFYLFYQFYIRS